MKKIFFILIPVLLLCGCSSKEKKQDCLKKATEIYYNSYIKEKVKGLNELEISLADLREIKDDDINLEEVSKCSDETSVVATIKKQKIVDYEINLKCK